MHLFEEMIWKYFCLCVVVVSVNAKGRRSRETKHYSGLDLLKNRPLSSSNRHEVENLSSNQGQTFKDPNSTDINYLKLHKVLRKRTKAVTVDFVGYSNKKSYATLFGIYQTHKPLPLVEIGLDILRRKVVLRYQGVVSFQRVNITFGKELVNWNVLSAEVNKTHFTVTVGCSIEKSVKLRQKPEKIPRKSVGILASDKFGKNRFIGHLFEARFYPHPSKKKSLLCSKQVNIQQDVGYVKDGTVVNGDRILLLEQQITQLNKMVDTLKIQGDDPVPCSQNANLTGRVADLESCDCVSECQWEGQMFDEGETWSQGKCTVCICKNGKADCLQRTDIPSCQTPCLSNPCMNLGQCMTIEDHSFPTDFQCQCPTPYDGQLCEQKENPCVWPRESGICDQNLPRFYYDMESQKCLPFNYTGCGGNVNNYDTLEECQAVAVKGACCFRQYSLNVEDVIVSAQKETFGCKEISLSECQSTHRQVIGDNKVEVISFYPGVGCAQADCAKVASECIKDGRKYAIGEKANLGCQACTCESSGQFVCSCSQKAIRKEIRDLTSEELAQFQAAVQQLRLIGPGNPWEEFRDIYMTHSMHSNGGPYFLPWHRLFLRKLEQKLQEIDCGITLPYYDFTTDVGNFSESILWQPNFFGGDGIDGCVVDHPYGLPGSWRPCIRRSFNKNVKLPTLIEMSLALASEDYTEMSMCLEAYVSYIHTYIGGDMATRAASYDPVFYSVHAYIDMLYWWWQNKGSNKFKYPAAFANIPMVPFNVPPSAILDLEADLCVKYIGPGEGSPCNRTDVDAGSKGPIRGDVAPQGDKEFAGGFNSLGYNSKGFDRRRFDKNGYRENGYNRDGYNKIGYDIYGYDRYGYDKDGYSPYGYDADGWNKEGIQDLTGRYNSYGLDTNCLTRRGFTTSGYDKFGFNVQGYDADRCNYYFKGPYGPRQSHQIWRILLQQPKSFLMTLSRTCPGLEPLPRNWLQQYWITDIKDVSEMIPVASGGNTVQINSARFCFDIDDFVTPCGCDLDTAVCTENPCLTMACPSYPEASCSVDFCGVCKPRWYLNGKQVDCFEERDFCQPNPCENGGTCVSSIWPSEPQLTTCLCPPGFDGHYCQYTSLDTCDLPLSPGSCANRQTRWYFDHKTQSCKSFIYSGCGGNANNFEYEEFCENRCKIGACCYRTPTNLDVLIGYDKKGYDVYDYDVSGISRRGDVRIDVQGTFRGRYDWQGYDGNGYDLDGLDRLGLDKEGYNRDGFNLTGYSRTGEYDGIIDYDTRGYDPEGYNRAGYSCYGTNREGLNVFGVNSEFTYKCRAATLYQCQKVESKPGHQVVKFTRGKLCSDVTCEANCGCSYNNNTYRLGETFRSGCQFCTCMLTGSVTCTCSTIHRRKEIRDMTDAELEKYQQAIQSLNKMGYPSKWFQFAQTYADYRAQALGNAGSLPWHRYFLRLIERQLQEIDCSITIPYYDWTINAGNQDKASIWAANKFGGDGSDIKGCVDHHPFKDYYPPYLVPCLRRQFNTSVPLPDAVDLQNALNEPTYEQFRLSMEVYMDIFKSWVGGHMDTEYSPYDPLFLSVAAFIDRIWWDWQSKYDDGQYRYPQELRYIPMMPFKNTPDDVMDSKKDMCVTYFPLSEGAACNVTLPKYTDNSMGYDRHGFNSEGYDIEGFNMFGVDRNGKADERGIFNTKGFDRQGFLRNGYDSMGWDRFGFYIDNFNTNGYTPAGYDRQGYDRYGFDRNGVSAFGFNRNGSGIVNTLPDVFDSYGYNRYGLNRYGFDREGYDVFGFDSLGYDRRRCNRHFLGPMLVIIKRWVELELEKLDNKTIRVITRICPQVDNRPEWRYTLNWLKRGDQVPLIEGILGRAQARVRELEEQETGVTQHGVWLPVGPDKDLCFVTYYYTECPFGKAPVECPEDLCARRQCPGYPEAVCRINRCGECNYEWYNGITGALLECTGCVDRRGVQRQEDTSWAASDCETCTCQGGKISCAETRCPIVTCSHAVKYPGQCCLQCDAGCDYNGIIYLDGGAFQPPDDKCANCTCTDGSIDCRPVGCPDLGTCSSTTILEGGCCPTCLDCGNHDNGDEWLESPCHACACIDGQVQCQMIRCIPPDCSHPRVKEGECCASCDGCTVNGRNMEDGETYMPDTCTECVCSQGNVVCDPTPCPLAPCLNAITPEGECCPRCDIGCQFQRQQFRHGESFIRDCNNCTCVNSFMECNPVTCLRMNLPCRQPITVPGDCCPSLCPKCVADGVEYSNGATWTSRNDPCETCVCEEGISACTRIDQCPVECDHGVYRPQECCSECIDCLYNGLQVRDGQTFVKPGDNCQQCSCSRGHVTCQSLGPCPRLPCRVTETPPGACCPQCKRCEYQGRSYSHGDKVSMDLCSTCYCRDGEVTCERVACPEPKCRYPQQVPGECCPVCLQCEYKGKSYTDGQRFTPLREPCLDCTCRAGEVSCETRESDCPVARCTHPIRTRQQCCPVCDGCLYQRKRIRNGQKFVPPGKDNCQVCRCSEGSVTCMNMGCPAVNCHNAVLVKGQCCPVCPMGCNVMGIQYRDGQTFIDFMDRCKVCTCMMGQIRCMAMMSCERATCTHPALRPGNCCPSCTMCDWNNAQYRNGEVFTNAANLCEECTCKDGSVTCRSKAISCQKPNCLDPVMDPDTCCPTCQSKPCTYAGRQYRDGQLVPATRAPCETCTCSQGLIDCTREPCPPVSCRHPGRDQCCETCEHCVYRGMRFELGEMFPSKDDQCQDCVCQAGSVMCTARLCDCVYRGMRFELGEMFPSKDNPCQDCVCQAGSVRCTARLCGVPNCQNPVYLPGGCCPECSDCTYLGILYKDGENFSNPAQPCEICHCMKGNVACDRRQCPEANCEHPALDGCCPKCADCQYNNQVHPNGATFPSRDGCSDCQCRYGNVQCSRRSCPRVQCPRAFQGRCCLECPEDLRAECTYNGGVYQDGETVPSVTNACSVCVCNRGQVDCRERRCPETSCTHPARIDCCNECRNCNYTNREYKHGQRFTDECQECVCSAGSVQCREKSCPAVTCANPVIRDCCPMCLTGGDCMHKGRVYRHGDPIRDPRDPCNKCVCQAGSVRCEQTVCGPITCRHPVMGTCCPECADCQLGTKRIADGSEYPDVNDHCSICMCKAGNITCHKPECEPVLCSNPRETDCGCPSCWGCKYHGKEVSEGRRFEDPTDRCRECQCHAGDVHCSTNCPAHCDHPADSDGCCPICQSCLYEGQIQIEGTRFHSVTDPCQQCSCKGGNVTCMHVDCPRANCDNPVAKPGQCCATCAECTHNGRTYTDGQVFRDESSQCQVCSCLAGRIRCEPEQCRQQCSHPIPGRCCPSCDQCLYQGSVHRNGAEFSTDTCTRCICRDGSVSCSRQTCPSPTCARPVSLPGQCCPICQLPTDCRRERIGALNRPDVSNPCLYCLCQSNFQWQCQEERCPEVACSGAVVPPGGCCPQCLGCFDMATSREYQEGQVWTHTNNCNTCTCKSGAIECAVTVCGPITCNIGERLVDVPGQCCPVCQRSGGSRGCYIDGTFKQEMEEWQPDVCRTCQCVRGEVSCTSQACLSPRCSPSDVLTIPPGSCCPVCVPKPGTCKVYGDPHYTTFDGRDFPFQGSCRYIMAQDCDDQDFRVEVQHDSRGVEGVSWAQNFTITITGAQIDILQNHEILVNGRAVMLPYSMGSELAIERLENNMLVNTRVGVQFVWDGRSHAEVMVPGNYKSKTCGLCGNFNGFPVDDLKTRDGQIVNSAALFGNSWKARDQPSGSCSDATDTSPCTTAGYRVRQRAASTCEVIRGPKFSACHRVVTMNPYFDSCVYDLCACTDIATCLCDVLATYAKECAKAGVRLEWRSRDLCPIACDTGSGFMFDECGPACNRTCDNMLTPLGVVADINCLKPCVPGCQCSADKLVHQGRCITPQECPNYRR